jgi:outer membrane protein insertion porin family
MDISSLLDFRVAPNSARRAILAISLGAGLCGSPLFAQDFEGKPVSNVEVRYAGEKTVDEARIRASISTHGGDAYRAEKVDGDIKSLYDSGLVENVRVLAEPNGEAVNLIYEVTTRPPISGVGFSGNTVFKDARLARETKLKAGGSLSDAEVISAKQNIEKLYRDSGYPDVTISTKTQNSSVNPGHSDLVFIIDEGTKNEVRDIRFQGNSVYDSKVLKQQMTIKEKGIFSFITKSGKFESQQLDDDLEKILDYYRSHGYLRASSSGIQRVPVSHGRVDLIIPINEGAKYTVAGVGFGPMTVFKDTELYPGLSMVGGDGYSSKKMRDDIKMIRSYYGSRGYADCEVSPDIRDAGPNKVNIVYRIKEGSRYRVGRVNIGGNTKTQDKVIRREMTLKPNDWFNSVELETSKTRLDNLQYFSTTRVEGDDNGRSGYRDINVMVNEKQTGSVQAGVGFSSIDSIVGFISLTQTNFDVTNPWAFTGAGQRFSSELRLGTERKDLTVSLTEPWFLGKQLALGGDLFYRESQYYSDSYDQTNAGADIFIRKPLGPKSYIRVEYKLEDVTIDVDSSVKKDHPDSLLIKEDGSFLKSSSTLDYVFDDRDSPIESRKGQKIDVGLSLAGLGGDVNDYSLSVQAQKYWNWKWDSIFSLNGELATVDSTNSDEVPIFDRLFLGGGHTLRGYEFRDVGPRDTGETNDTVGGKSLGFLSAEATIPVIDTIRAAAFYDMGFVNTDAWDMSAGDLYTDAGFGIRIKLPISPVPLALDYAIPLNTPDPEADKGGQFNFYLNYQY